MKKLIVLIFLSAVLCGCGAAAQKSEFWDHDTMYKNNEHLWFSWSGYQSPSAEWAEKSKEQGWWGIEIPYNPNK